PASEPSAKMWFAEFALFRTFPQHTSTSLDTRCSSRLFLRLAFELHRIALAIAIRNHMIPGQDFAVENLQGEWILNHALNGTPQRTRAISGIVTFAPENFLRRRRKLERYLAFQKQRLHALEEQADNSFELCLAKRIENHDFVDPVNKFGPECSSQGF